MSTSHNKHQGIAATLFALLLGGLLIFMVSAKAADAQIPPASDGSLPGYSIDDPSRYCGDGSQSMYEECEDGNTVSGDGCSAACTLENAAPPAPTVSVVVNPSSITSGGSSVVSWSSSGASSCSGTGVSTGGATSGQVSVSPTATTVYSVSCTGAGGTTSQSRTVTVGSAPTATATLTANPTSVSAGATSMLTWSSTNAASCSGTGFSTGGATSGSVSTAALTTGSHSYSVTCGGAVASATVTAETEGCEGTTCSQVCVYVPSVQPSVAQVSSQDGRVGIGAAQIVFGFNAGAGSGPPGPPIISGPTTRGVYESGTYGFIATDPDGDTIRYLVDWNMDGVVDQILPGTGYVASNTSQSANKSWAATGSQTFQARTEDSTGGVSGWSTYSVTVAAAAECSDGIDNDLDGKVDYPVDTGCESADDTTEDPDAPAGPTANLSGPASVVGGERATLTWSSTNATSCTGTGFSTGGATSGSVQTAELTSPPSSYSYRVACAGPGGTAMDIHTVGITGAGVNIMAAPTRVKKGTATSLTWSATQVASCTVTGTNGFSAVGLTGTNVSSGAIQSQTTFTLSCDGGAVSDSVIVDILPVIDEV